MMMSLVEEMMQMPSDEQMAEMEQGWMEMMSSMGMDPAQMEQAWADWEAQMEAEWQANGGLMGMLGMTGEDMQMIEQMISSGELENMLMEFLSSGALEQMMMEFMAD